MRLKHNLQLFQYKKSSILLISILFLLYFLFYDFNTQIFLFFPSIFANCDSRINLIIQGSGKQNVLYSNFYINASEVIVNNISKKNECNKTCELDKEINEITLVFEEQITSSYNMFYMLENITEVDLSEFDASMITHMNSMFRGCVNLEKIKFGKINTSSLRTMVSLFYNCHKLSSVDLSNFDTSNLISFWHIFYNCYNLQYINLKNLNTSKIYFFDYIFYNCKSLQYLDLSNFDISKGIDFQGMFYNCSSLIYLNISHFKIENMYEYYTPIFSGIFPNIKCCIKDNSTINYLTEKGENILCNCSDICFSKNLKLIDIEQNTCVESCSPNKYEYNHICYNQCPNGTFPDNINNNCSDDPDINLNTYESTKIASDSLFNDYKTTFIDNSLYATNSEIKSTLINTNNKEKIYKYFENIELSLVNNFDTSYIDSGKDLLYNTGEISITITKTDRQMNIINNKETINSSIIDLGECEFKLKQSYNISQNDNLYILKVENTTDGITPQKTGYEVFYPFNGNNMTKLDLSICTGITIDIYIPLNLSIEDREKLDPKSKLYNDICDKSFKDRRKEFEEISSKYCSEGCYSDGYLDDNLAIKCSCYTKVELPLDFEIKFDKEKLKYNFKNIKNIANFKLLKCTHLLFNKNNIFKNTANYLMLFLFILSIIAISFFIFKNNKKINDDIDKIIESKIINDKKNDNIINNNKNKSQDRHDKNKSIESNNLKLGKKHEKNIILNNPGLININQNNNYINNKKINIKKVKKKKRKSKFKKSNIKESIPTSGRHVKSKKMGHNKINDINDKKKINQENLETYNPIELNELNYEDALKYDKRNYFEYYKSLIITKQTFIFSFINYKDYNSQTVKIYIFFLTFMINYTISAMFYSDDLIRKIDQDNNSFDFTYQLPIMFYSLLITTVIHMALKFLGLYEGAILTIKEKKNELNKQDIKRRTIIIKIKVILFFIVTYILLIFCWLFSACFCVVYKNTQIHLLLDVLSSFGISSIIPFFVCLLPGIFRIKSLSDKNGKKPYLYKFSKLLQIF